MGAPSFLSEAPSEPVEFEVGGWKRRGDGDDRVEVRETFLARRDVSYGLLLQNIEQAEGGTGSLLAIFDLVLDDPADLNQDGGDDDEPEDAAEPEDGLTPEARRFREFVGSEDVYVSQKALIDAARWINSRKDLRLRGICAVVIRSGTVQPGDEIRKLPPTATTSST